MAPTAPRGAAPLAQSLKSLGSLVQQLLDLKEK